MAVNPTELKHATLLAVVAAGSVRLAFALVLAKGPARMKLVSDVSTALRPEILDALSIDGLLAKEVVSYNISRRITYRPTAQGKKIAGVPKNIKPLRNRRPQRVCRHADCGEKLNVPDDPWSVDVGHCECLACHYKHNPRVDRNDSTDEGLKLLDWRKPNHGE